MGRRKALIIAFSGVDGAGKSTQIGLLEDHLRRSSSATKLLWARGGYTPLFSAVKKLLRRAAGGKLPKPGPSAERSRTMSKWWVRRVWLFISIVDLGLLYAIGVRWWKLRGRTVICDRYLADTRIDFTLNFPDAGVERWWLWRALEKLAPRPDAWFLMLLPVEESLRRCRAKNEPFPDSEERLRQRLDHYHELPEKKHQVVLDARDSIEDLFDRIRAECDRLALSGRSGK